SRRSGLRNPRARNPRARTLSRSGRGESEERGAGRRAGRKGETDRSGEWAVMIAAMAESSTPVRPTTLFGRADLQVHTSFGDGMDSALTIFERVERHAFLDLIAITDHDDVRGALEARETYER